MHSNFGWNPILCSLSHKISNLFVRPHRIGFDQNLKSPVSDKQVTYYTAGGFLWRQEAAQLQSLTKKWTSSWLHRCQIQVNGFKLHLVPTRSAARIVTKPKVWLVACQRQGNWPNTHPIETRTAVDCPMRRKTVETSTPGHPPPLPKSGGTDAHEKHELHDAIYACSFRFTCKSTPKTWLHTHVQTNLPISR